MKILIVSDTHGRVWSLEQVLKKVCPIDCFIHLGDVEGDAEYIRSLLDGVPSVFVAGNNDYRCGLPDEAVFSIGKYRVFAVHGHAHSVYFGTERLLTAARRNGADIVMYGHTHRPSIVREDGLVILNPGSLTFPRQENRKPSYILMDLDREGEAHFTIRYLS